MQKHKALILACALWSAAAAGQVPVVEAGGRGNQAQAGNSNELVGTLYTQLEALQQEVQTLRGLVEEQSYQIRRIQTEQRDRYLDIDRRLSELAGTPASGAPPAALPGTTLPGAEASPPAAAGSDTASDQMNEQDLYRTALNLLLEQSKYEESVQMFQSYIDRFPRGRLLTNAWYWQGEALILASRFNEARDVFTQLITNYPEDPKAAGAMLKLGVVYQQMGDAVLAAQTWRDIAIRYPKNATEIRAAQDYLNRQ